MQIKNYRPVDKGCLKGFLTLQMDKWGVEISDIGIFQKDSKRWCTFPQKTFEKEGKMCYYPYIKFLDATHMKKFQDSLLDLLDKWVAANPVLAPEQHAQNLEEELPF